MNQKKGETEINWDQIYQDFIEWAGRSISTKEIWLYNRTIILIKIDPNCKIKSRTQTYLHPGRLDKLTSDKSLQILHPGGN